MPREIIIDGIIGTEEGQFSAAMIRSMLPPTNEPIVVKFHSEGGSVFEGFQIANEFKNYAGPKTAIVSESCGSWCWLVSFSTMISRLPGNCE